MSPTNDLRRPALTLLATVLVGSAALVATPQAGADPVLPAAGDITVTTGDPLLDAPRRGERAIRALGDQLPTAAARNDLRPGALRSLLRSDNAAWVDTEGSVFYVDPVHESSTTTATEPQAAATAPLADTFALHSNPGSSLKILLDFDGAEVKGTAWNDYVGVAPGVHPAWDPAGNGSSFADSELRSIQQAWAMVAEDFAPFDVDVTTEDPGAAALVRSSSTDTSYGIRVLITPSDDPYAVICDRRCGGVAYLGVFDRVGSYAQPAWVFPQALGDDVKAVAEAASHEAGHNLDLDHDGGPANPDYYTGHGIWAPIMGVGYSRPLAQWSAGAYPGANNQQNDVATIAGYLGHRSDEASGTVPAPLPEGEAFIATRSDVDAWLLGSCAAGSTVAVAPAAVAPNLDVRATLHDSTGTARATAAPVSGVGDGTTAAGLGASVVVPTDGDGWTLKVEGVGEGTWSSSGYDDYGSLGAYTISAPDCGDMPGDAVPSSPTAVAASDAGLDRLTVTWSPPTSEGTGPVTGYQVSVSGAAGSVALSADARSHTFTGLAAETSYELSVRAVNAIGAGPAAQVTASTLEPPPVAPSAPQGVTGSYDHASGSLRAWWTAPADPGTHPIEGYTIHLDGVLVGQSGPDVRSVTLNQDPGFAEGQYDVSVAAVSAAGTSPVGSVTITVDHPEDAPLRPPASTSTSSVPSQMEAPRVVVRGRKVIVRWRAAVANGSPVTRYRLDLRRGRDRTYAAGARKAVLKRLRPGRHRVRITAVSAAGVARYSTWARFRVRRSS